MTQPVFPFYPVTTEDLPDHERLKAIRAFRSSNDNFAGRSQRWDFIVRFSYIGMGRRPWEGSQEKPMMMKMTEISGRELRWVQPKGLKMEYELRQGELAAATLRFRNSFGSLATAECADGSWEFNRVGFLRTRVIVRKTGTDSELAVYRNSAWGSGGTLELLDGRKISARANAWGTQFELRTGNGEVLVRCVKIGGLLHMSSVVEIPSPSADIAENPWMVLLSWYLALMIMNDSAAVVAAI